MSENLNFILNETVPRFPHPLNATTDFEDKYLRNGSSAHYVIPDRVGLREDRQRNLFVPICDGRKARIVASVKRLAIYQIPLTLVYHLITVEGEKVVKNWVDAVNMSPIEAYGNTYSAVETLEALNYGTPPLFLHLASLWSTRRDIRALARIWDRALLKDLAKELFQDKKDVYKLISGVNLGLRGAFEDYMSSENSQLLLGVLGTFQGVLGREDFRPPGAYIIRDLIASVRYLMANMTNEAISSRNPALTCAMALENFWRTIFDDAGLPLDIDGKDLGVTIFHLSRFIDSLLGDGQYLAIINKTPTRWIKARSGEILITRLHLEPNKGQYFRDVFLSIAGITQTDLVYNGELLGPLDGLKASNLVAGPFTVTLTANPGEHLTFSGSHSHTTVRLLNIKGIFQLYIPQRVGVARTAEISTLFLELMYSHVLFFGRDKTSEKVGENLGVDMDLIRDFRDNYSPVQSDLQLQHFPIYAVRLRCIQKKMDRWRPQTFRELAVRPYQDPLPFYAFWFATIVGIVSLIGLGAGLAQAIASVKAVS